MRHLKIRKNTSEWTWRLKDLPPMVEVKILGTDKDLPYVILEYRNEHAEQVGKLFGCYEWKKCEHCEGKEFQLTDEFDFEGPDGEIDPVQKCTPCSCQLCPSLMSAGYAARNAGYKVTHVLVRKEST
jgi:hypothetical protein